VTDRPLRLLGIGNANSIIFLRWAWRLAERGHEVHVVSNRFSDRPGELDGIHPHDIRDLGGLTRLRGLRRLVLGGAIRGLARDLGIDLVHAHYLLPYGGWAASADLHPLVVSPWNTDIFTFGRERRRGRRTVAKAVAAGDEFVVSSLGNAEETVRLGAPADRVHRIVWYADVRPFGPEHRDPELRRRLGWSDDSLVVLSLRNYRQNTNLDVLVRAFARAQREVPQARLVLAARGGWTKEEIDRLLDDLTLRDYVAQVEALSHELPLYTASADLGVSIASTDATPASMLESMAARLPMVMGDAVTIDEWIAPGEGGEVVECRDEDAVTEALVKLLRDPDLRRRYGERNERVVRERLGDPGEQLESLYLRLLGERPA
jgi:glycosyltransferase involved in cell wall biosynthesis